MTIETEPTRERLRPRIMETEETGRLELRLPSAAETPVSSQRSARSRSPIAVAMTGLGILVIGLAGIELFEFIDSAFARGAALGTAAAVAVAAGCGGAGYWLAAELRSLFRLRSAERLRRLIPTALSGEMKLEIDAAALILARDPLLGEAVARYRAVLEPHHTGRDALDLFSRFVLGPADRLAKVAIGRAASQAFAINAISPTALLDTLLFAARAIRMVREIAEIYGQRPGFAGTLHLLRRLASGAGLVGAVDSLVAYWSNSSGAPSLSGSAPAPPRALMRRKKWRALASSRWRFAGPSSSGPAKSPRCAA
jgi:putative membrane protein